MFLLIIEAQYRPLFFELEIALCPLKVTMTTKLNLFSSNNSFQMPVSGEILLERKMESIPEQLEVLHTLLYHFHRALKVMQHQLM